MSVSRRKFLKIGGLSITTFGLTSNLFSRSPQAGESQLKNMVNGIQPLTPEDYEKRMKKAQRLLAEHKMDALFLSGSTNLIYFTKVGWGRSERTFGAVINRKGRPIWVCPAFERKRAEERIPEGDEIRVWEEDESPYKLIAGILKDLGAARGRLGLGPTVRNFVYYGLHKDAPGLDLVNGAVITEGCRGIKNDKEIAYMDLAGKITKLAYKEAFKKLREGMTTGELSSFIRRAHQEMGVRGGGGAQFGPNSAFPHGSSVVRNLHAGDSIVVGDHKFAADVFELDSSQLLRAIDSWKQGRISEETSLMEQLNFVPVQ